MRTADGLRTRGIWKRVEAIRKTNPIYSGLLKVTSKSISPSPVAQHHGPHTIAGREATIHGMAPYLAAAKIANILGIELNNFVFVDLSPGEAIGGYPTMAGWGSGSRGNGSGGARARSLPGGFAGRLAIPASRPGNRWQGTGHLGNQVTTRTRLGTISPSSLPGCRGSGGFARHPPTVSPGPFLTSRHLRGRFLRGQEEAAGGEEQAGDQGRSLPGAQQGHLPEERFQVRIDEGQEARFIHNWGL
jgi:hypothetical protein